MTTHMKARLTVEFEKRTSPEQVQEVLQSLLKPGKIEEAPPPSAEKANSGENGTIYLTANGSFRELNDLVDRISGKEYVASVHCSPAN